jgi:hypothetical protein
MSNFFIQYRPYQGLDTIERLLMSWIIGLHDNKQTICFSNQYAAKVVETSDRTIRTKINSLVEKGYIKTHITPTRRFIQVINIPTLEDIRIDLCDLDEPTQTEGGNNFHPPQENISIGEEIVSIGEEITSTNIIDYKLDYKLEDIIVSANTQNPSQQEEDDLELFTFMFVEFNEPDKEFDVLYDYWKNKLSPQEQMNAVKYSSNFRKYCEKKKWSKSMYWYFKEKKFNWSSIRN